MENSLLELWSLFNFVQPGLLGDINYFEREFCKAIIKGGYTDANPVEHEAAKHMIAELRKRMRLHFMRRTKK
jgi:SNF2 family DNA or RNA helicase